MRKTLTVALAMALFAGGALATSAAQAGMPGPGNFAPGGNGPPPQPPGFGGPGGFAQPQPPGGGGGGGAWPMPPGGGWGGWGGGFGVTIAPPIYTTPAMPTAGGDLMKQHIAYCVKRWKTYDIASDMYMSNNGPRPCISPVSPYL
jgi:hypothetical protein